MNDLDFLTIEAITNIGVIVGITLLTILIIRTVVVGSLLKIGQILIQFYLKVSKETSNLRIDDTTHSDWLCTFVMVRLILIGCVGSLGV